MSAYNWEPSHLNILVTDNLPFHFNALLKNPDEFMYDLINDSLSNSQGEIQEEYSTVHVLSLLIFTVQQHL